MPVWLSNIFRLRHQGTGEFASDKVLFAFIVYSRFRSTAWRPA